MIDGSNNIKLAVLIDGSNNIKLAVLIDGSNNIKLAVLIDGSNNIKLAVLIDGSNNIKLAVLIDGSNNIKLADFGISKQLETLSSTHGAKTDLVGTVKWMAPEIITGKEYGLKVDIWSVACTIVEMLTTYPPWNTLTDMLTITKISLGQYPAYVLPDLRCEVDDFLRECFQIDPNKRLSANESLATKFCKLSIAGELR